MIPENKYEKQAKNTTVKRMFSLSVESIAFWSGVITVAFTVFAALAGVLSWFFSHQASIAKDEALLKFKEESKIELARANEAAEKAKENATKARQKTAELNIRAAALEKETEQAKLEAEHEKLERIKLEKQISPRRITSEMKQQLVNSLIEFTGRKIMVKSYSFDIESAVLGMQIVSLLQLSNIDVSNNVFSHGSSGHIIMGINITGNNKKLVNKLIESLSSICNLSVQSTEINNTRPYIVTGIDPDIEKDMDAIIFVGAKPMQQLYINK